MATKTKMPDGMAPLLDSIGRDTLTARLCVAGDYQAAIKWVETNIGAGDAVRSGWADSDGRASKQTELNRLRAQSYTQILAMLNELVA